MAGITIANASPPPQIVEWHIGETVYEGQLVMDCATAGTGGHCQIIDVAGEAQEDAYAPVGVVLGAINARTEYNSTYKGQVCTYTVTSATMAADEDRKDAATAQVAIVQPFYTVLRAPIYDAAFGTAMTECTEVTGGSYTAYTDTTNTYSNDIADDWGTMYVRTGANRGLYRVMTSHTTSVCTTTLKFPYANAIGDTFMRAAVKLGHAHLYFGATANYVDGDQALTNYYHCFVTKIGFDTAGQEWCEFMFYSYVHGHT